MLSCLFRDRPAPPGDEGPDARGAALRVLTASDIYKPERFAGLCSLARACEGPDVTKLVLPGDLLGGSLFATAHRGESVIDVLNALPQLDYCTLGNHEFDFGGARTQELMASSKFRWLGSNVREVGPEGRILPGAVDYDTFEVPLAAGPPVKVGVFGLCTQATPELSAPGPEITFEAPVAHATRCVAALQAAGCELILAFTHLSVAQDREVAESCPGIRAILGGHDHDPYLLVRGGTLIAKCGQNADHLGVLDLFLERGGPGGALECRHSFQLLSTWGASADPLVMAAVERWRGAGGGEEEVLCAVGPQDVSTRSQELRSQESAFGGMVADAILWSYAEQGCQAAVQNGGFIRQDNLYPSGSSLSAAQVREEMPFPKVPVLLRASGRQLRRGLEEMLANTPAAHGSFPQLSEGLFVAYCPTGPPLEKIRRLELGGAPVDPDGRYLIAISEFYTEKDGDGVAAFAAMERVGYHGRLVRDLTVDYLAFKGHLSGELPGRIVKAP